MVTPIPKGERSGCTLGINPHCKSDIYLEVRSQKVGKGYGQNIIGQVFYIYLLVQLKTFAAPQYRPFGNLVFYESDPGTGRYQNMSKWKLANILCTDSRQFDTR